MADLQLSKRSTLVISEVKHRQRPLILSYIDWQVSDQLREQEYIQRRICLLIVVMCLLQGRLL